MPTRTSPIGSELFIIVVLNETIRLMKKIDEVIQKHGGWPGAFISTAMPESASHRQDHK